MLELKERTEDEVYVEGTGTFSIHESTRSAMRKHVLMRTVFLEPDGAQEEVAIENIYSPIWATPKKGEEEAASFKQEVLNNQTVQKRVEQSGIGHRSPLPQFYDSEEDRFLMEGFSGQSLREFTQSINMLEISETEKFGVILLVMGNLVEAIQRLDAQGISHRDLNSGNILILYPSLNVKIIDLEAIDVVDETANPSSTNEKNKEPNNMKNLSGQKVLERLLENKVVIAMNIMLGEHAIGTEEDFTLPKIHRAFLYLLHATHQEPMSEAVSKIRKMHYDAFLLSHLGRALGKPITNAELVLEAYFEAKKRLLGKMPTMHMPAVDSAKSKQRKVA